MRIDLERGELLKRVSNFRKKGQAWSLDLIIGVVLFLLILVVVYSLLSSKPTQNNELRSDADKIFTKMDAINNPSQNLPKVVQGNSLSEDELIKLYGLSYDELKAEMGVTEEFCIVVVDDFDSIIV
ncbi:hypothetical protein COV13_02955, partial [Candidatus Woesearchaeota archaeon CG10_big_fil_rev_8_21_14_0_10_32_9]